MLRTRCMLLVALVLVLGSIWLPAQAKSGSKPVFTGNAPEPDPFNPTASEYGVTGLWKVISADTPPARSFGLTTFIDRINRNPGQMTITTIGEGLFFSPHDRVELGVQVNLNRRVLARRQDQLSWGQAYLFGRGFSGGCPGCPILQAPVAMPGLLIPQLRNTQTNALTGRAGYYPLLPYVLNRSSNGVAEVVVSGKVNFLSENRGDKVSVALRPWIAIPTHISQEDLFNVGNQTGEVAAGMDLLISKNVGNAGLHFNGGFAYFPDSKKRAGLILNQPNMIPLKVGLNIPRTTRLQFIGEITSEIMAGGTSRTSIDSGNPVDITGGFRAYPWNWMAFTAGYRHTLNQFGGDKNGFVATVSATYIPVAAVPVLVPPTLTCSADPRSGLAGTIFRLTAQASTTTGRTLNYAWATPQGKLDGTGPSVRFDSTGLRPGDYNATVRVDDGAGGFADCTVTVTVNQPPRPNPPTASCSVDRGSVNQGEFVTFTVRAATPDNRPLRYAWTSTGGSLQGSGTSVRLDTTNLAPGTYTASVRVTDDRNLSAECSASTTVRAIPPQPVMSKLNECTFKPKVVRVDNVCKAILDDVALRLQSDSDSTSVVIGYHTEGEAPRRYTGPSYAAQRASNVKLYLVNEKGIADGRVQVRAATEPGYKIEMYLVPRGASYTGAGQIEKESPSAKPYPGHKPPKKAPAKKAAPKAETKN